MRKQLNLYANPCTLINYLHKNIFLSDQQLNFITLKLLQIKVNASR